MPLHEDCTPGHVYSFPVKGNNAKELQENAIKVANLYFTDMEYEMTIIDICIVPSQYGAYSCDFEGICRTAVRYDDRYAKQAREQQGNPFGMILSAPEGDLPAGGYA